MSSENWIILYSKGRRNRPGIAEIMAFLPDGVGALFQELSRHLAREYDVGCKPPTYTETDGWVYRFGRYDIHLLSHVSMEDGAFSVQGLRISDGAGLREALEIAGSLYDSYKEHFTRTVAAKKEKQKHNTHKRMVHERSELEAISGMIDKARFNRYHWSPKLSRHTLKRLYESDAKGLMDEELIDNVGYTLYARCLQGRDERLLIESGKLKCHHLYAVFPYR